ncbi:hypothetical protein OG393_05330 [Streptomyces sp. NBC_01216]|uniref:hypothetical protein n=1 Tax=Streptomyces sp. NBC_01216 TaxID=2903778 RepID=UPI002E0E1F52|nr:hypothetical protein OG393_05330 [Streptomyces sp. NBC_01216]
MSGAVHDARDARRAGPDLGTGTGTPAEPGPDRQWISDRTVDRGLGPAYGRTSEPAAEPPAGGVTGPARETGEDGGDPPPPVAPGTGYRAPARATGGGHRPFSDRYPAHIPVPPTAPYPHPTRSSFRPVTIRTARDAVAASAGYLRWLGFRDVVQPEERVTGGVDLRAPGLVAQVDPSTRPASLRAVECLWLNGLSTSAVSVFFSLAGYTPEARSRADELGVPLFVLDLTGTPQPVNGAAGDLASDGV